LPGKNKKQQKNLWMYPASPTGFEVHLTATGIGAKNNKSYMAVTRDENNFGKFFFFIGAGGGNRTDGPR
jgi:hypothetical protein